MDQVRRGDCGNLTFRTRIQPTISGEDVRITLSNEFGTGPLTVNTVSVAKGYEYLPQAVQTWTRKTVTFGGRKQFCDHSRR